MAVNNRNTRSSPTSPAPKDGASAPPAKAEAWEALDYSELKVLSFGYTTEVRIQITGEPYDAFMPRISRSDHGLVPVLPVKDLGDGADALLILPGTLHSWFRRTKPAVGTKWAVKQTGLDVESGARQLAVMRL